jgi:hypothetical protein
MKREEKKEKNALQNWSDSTLRLAINTGFECEYCRSGFFASIENYYAFEVEHIVPRGRGPEIDEAPENLTVACRTCNRLKRRWDPRSKVGELATREQLIKAAREYVIKQRQEKSARIKEEQDEALRILARKRAVKPGTCEVSNPEIHTVAVR